MDNIDLVLSKFVLDTWSDIDLKANIVLLVPQKYRTKEASLLWG